MIKWKEFEPYWERVARSMIEVIYENKFTHDLANYENIDGIVATHRYWDNYDNFFPFREAIRFINLLKEKEEFYNAIDSFNRKIGVNWLKLENLPDLGNRIYGFYYILKPILSKTIDQHGEELLTVNFNT